VTGFLNRQYAAASTDEFLVADFASGENDRIPNFIHRVLPDFLPHLDFSKRRTLTYSTDLHGLRLDSLFGLFQEQRIEDRARAVHARLESMAAEASFRQEQADYLRENQDGQTILDKRIIEEHRIGQKIFDLGFLNNDVIGYLFEYYNAYTDALTSLEEVHRTMKPGGLLIVTQPCSLYPVDNLDVLKRVGFSFLEGLDVELDTGKSSSVGESDALDALSRLGHYTFLVLKRA
jgi:SAM-dependent methyltransferase